MAAAAQVRTLLCSLRLVRPADPSLTGVRREWVAKCLGQITDMNRSEVQAELKQVISEAFAAHTLWTTDWAGVQLKRWRPHISYSF